MKLATIKDIAREAGVSHTTVSYALRGRRDGPQIPDETRERIKAVAARLNYSRNAQANVMKTGKSDVVAYIDPVMGRAEYSGKILAGLMERCAESGYFVKLFSYDPAAPEASFARMFEQRPAGIVCRSVQSPAFEELQAQAEAHGVPVLSLSYSEAFKRGQFLVVDDFDGAAQAAHHLIELGHKDLGILAAIIPGPREQGFRDTAQKAGVGIKTKNIIRANSHSLELVPTLREILSGLDRPTAFFCVTDYHALRLMQAAYQANIRIPEQLTVVGYAGLEAAEYSSPPLTTVAHPGNHGALAANIILSLISANVLDFNVMNVDYLPANLIARESTTIPNLKQEGFCHA